ncbi:hypothetical protein KAT67_09355, partial [candidate division WOR-3 bacterium]|nr:hypothetical protein [candidate division WOR-3 bacterium]
GSFEVKKLGRWEKGREMSNDKCQINSKTQNLNKPNPVRAEKNNYCTIRKVIYARLYAIFIN